MAFGNVIYEQAPAPNPMGAALTSAASEIGSGLKSAYEIRNQRDQQLVTVAMQLLPRLAENPKMLKQFTDHPDFAQHILPAFNRMRLGSVFTKNPTGDWSLNIPADPKSLDQLAADKVQSGDLTLEKAFEMKSNSDPASVYYKTLMREAALEDASKNETIKPTQIADYLEDAHYQGKPRGGKADAGYTTQRQTGTKKTWFGLGPEKPVMQKHQVPALVEVLARHGINADKHFTERGVRKMEKASAANRAKKKAYMTEALQNAGRR